MAPVSSPRRLTAAEDFRLARREGRRYAGSVAVVYVRRTGRPETRVGVSVGRQVGTAVRRNRIRRRIREAIRLRGDLAGGVDLVVLPKAAAGEVPFHELSAALAETLDAAGVTGSRREPF